MNSLRRKIARLSTQGILLASIVTLVVVMMVVNQLLRSFTAMTDERAQKLVQQMTDEAKVHEEQIARQIHEMTLSKMKNIVEHDVPTLKTPFLENSASFIRRFIVDSYHLDPELLHVSFFSVQKGEIKAWQLASRQLDKGADPRTRYDRAKKAWIVPKSDGKDQVIPDETLLESLNAEAYAVKEIFVDKERALEAIAPIYDSDSAELDVLKQDGESIGYIRYIVSLDKMDKILAAEHAKAQQAIEDTVKSNAEAREAIASLGTRFEIFGFIVILLASGGVLAFSIRHSHKKAELIARPVRQLRDAAQVIAQGDYEQPIRVQSDDEIGQLAETFENMREKIRVFTSNLQDMVDERTKQISFEKAKIQEILDNIELGIITIDQSLTIDAQYAPHMEKLFRRPPQSVGGASLQDVMMDSWQADNDIKDRVTESLRISIGQEDLSYLANAIHLPTRGEFKVDANGAARTYSLDWKPILQDDQVSRVMLVTKDLTVELEMQKKVAAAQEQSLRLMQTVTEVMRSPRDRVFPFLRKVRETAQTLKKHLGSQDFEGALIDLHTIKGAARTLRLDSLASQVHELETAVKHGHGEGVMAFDQWLQGYLEIIQKVFGFDSAANPSATVGEVSLFNLVAQSVPSLLEHIQQYQLQLHRLRVDDEILTWPPQFIDTLRVILIHALNNSVDHGYALPIRSGKPARAIEIDVHAGVSGDQIVVSVEDHGFGLDLEKIRQKVRERGLPKEFESDPARALFEDGFSTAQEVSMTSGRGVGLSSVYRDVKNLGGSIAIRNVEQGSGTRLEIAIPLKRFQTPVAIGRVS